MLLASNIRGCITSPGEFLAVAAPGPHGQGQHRSTCDQRPKTQHHHSDRGGSTLNAGVGERRQRAAGSTRFRCARGSGTWDGSRTSTGSGGTRTSASGTRTSASGSGADTGRQWSGTRWRSGVSGCGGYGRRPGIRGGWRRRGGGRRHQSRFRRSGRRRGSGCRCRRSRCWCGSGRRRRETTCARRARTEYLHGLIQVIRRKLRVSGKGPGCQPKQQFFVLPRLRDTNCRFPTPELRVDAH